MPVAVGEFRFLLLFGLPTPLSGERMRGPERQACGGEHGQVLPQPATGA